MLCLRSTPLSHDLPSPAELLNSRAYQTNLPVVSSQSCSVNGDVNAKLQIRQDQQKILYDKSSKSLPVLSAQSPVRLFDPENKVWQPGTIQSVACTPRSYWVELENGSVFRRNRKHIRPTGKGLSDDIQNQIDVQPDDDVQPDICMTSDETNEISTSGDSKVPGTLNDSATPELRRSSRRNKGKMPEKLNL